MNAVRKFVESLHRNYREEGVGGVSTTAVSSYDHVKTRAIEQTVHRAARRGSRNVYDRPWDVLVLLDCARVDMMEAVADEYDFLGAVGEHVTPGTDSAEWMKRTFTDDYREEMAATLHVTANTKSHDNLEAADFLHLEEVWRDGWDDEHQTILPAEVTDRAIALHRERAPPRTIVHYMQPHTPFVKHPEVGSRDVPQPGAEETFGKTVPELAEEYSREELWEFHLANLRYVLDDVETLLENLDADRVVVSSDHGQALGERGRWGHYPGSFLDCLRTVPWCVTSATDAGTYDPAYDPESSSADADDGLSVEQKLKYLGYK